jgi:diacylglycerol kinase family enzyme
MTRRLAALTALMVGVVALVLMMVVAIVDFHRGAAGLTLLALALWAAWQGLVRRGALRVAGLAAGAGLAVVIVASLIAIRPGLVLGSMTALISSVLVGGYALRIRVPLRPASPPVHPVLFWNRHSGGGKALHHRLPEEARVRGIEPIELVPGKDFEQQVLAAMDAGADALAIAGGDGSQATVARLASERGLPFACIPAGTRNHFALDLGVDRDDVVGALDAFVDGGERVVDLGEVNGHVFVNNISIGLYGEAVHHAGYRNAKIRTLLETVPEVSGSEERRDLRWKSPDGKEHKGAVAIIVSNNHYRLGRGPGDGTRPRLDEGALGVVVLGAPGDEPGAWTWSTSSFEVHASGAVKVGADGEALVLEPPLRFRIRPAALHCRIARRHPGASPSAFEPDGAWAHIRTLVGIAAGRDPRPLSDTRHT